MAQPTFLPCGGSHWLTRDVLVLSAAEKMRSCNQSSFCPRALCRSVSSFNVPDAENVNLDRCRRKCIPASNQKAGPTHHALPYDSPPLALSGKTFRASRSGAMCGRCSNCMGAALAWCSGIPEPRGPSSHTNTKRICCFCGNGWRPDGPGLFGAPL